MGHVKEVVRLGLGPSGVIEAQARILWRGLDEIERFRIRRELGISEISEFIQLCEREAGNERMRRAREDLHIAAFYGRGQCV